MSDDERRKAAFTAIEELMSAFKELDPLQEFNPLPTSEEGMRREIEEATGSFNMQSAHHDVDDESSSGTSTESE